jgi:hypothetical protein
MPVEVLRLTVQLTELGKAHNTPLNVTALLQRYFPSLQRQDDLRVRIEPLRHPRTRKAARVRSSILSVCRSFALNSVLTVFEFFRTRPQPRKPDQAPDLAVWEAAR